ncbi:MAG: hypothetical protein QXO71_07270, partial [Candidatus Jordarchaeaceae archaeon]
VCANKEFRENLPAIISDLIKNPKEARERLKNEARLQKDSLVAHALRILVNLSEKGGTVILSQLERGGHNEVIDEVTEAIVLQLIASHRWEKEYEEPTFDLVLALPDWSKVIAVSTTEAEIPIEPLIPRLAKVSVENIHLYSFFNRAHAVRGRKISTWGHQEIGVIPRWFGPFMRTCSDIETIGRGLALPFFTPFFTNEGLRLGFFFTLLCEVDAVNWVRSPSGFGVTPDEVELILRDFNGCLRARMSTKIFNESLENPLQRIDVKPKDPMDLVNLGRKILIVGVWILGKEYPEIIFFSLIDNPSIDVWVASFMNSHRKVLASKLPKELNRGLVERALSGSSCVLKVKEWIYYKEEPWPTAIFLAMVENGFNRIFTLSDVLRFGGTFTDFKSWQNRVQKYFRINPHILELYRSQEPLELFKKMHKLLEEDKELKELALKLIPKEKPKLIRFTRKDPGTVLAVSKRLLALGYQVWDLFSPEWDNGGYLLERKYIRVLSLRKERALDEMVLALNVILTARGEVNIPSEAIVS